MILALSILTFVVFGVWFLLYGHCLITPFFLKSDPVIHEVIEALIQRIKHHTIKDMKFQDCNDTYYFNDISISRVSCPGFPIDLKIGTVTYCGHRYANIRLLRKLMIQQYEYEILAINRAKAIEILEGI